MITKIFTVDVQIFSIRCMYHCTIRKVTTYHRNVKSYLWRIKIRGVQLPRKSNASPTVRYLRRSKPSYAIDSPMFLPFLRRSCRCYPRSNARQFHGQSVTRIFDWRRWEDTASWLSVFRARFSAENSNEFRSRNPTGIAPCGQTSQGLGTLVWCWIETRLVGCRLASAGGSLRIAGRSSSSTIGLQSPSG